jgi:hypothetical protein
MLLIEKNAADPSDKPADQSIGEHSAQIVQQRPADASRGIPSRGGINSDRATHCHAMDAGQKTRHKQHTVGHPCLDHRDRVKYVVSKQLVDPEANRDKQRRDPKRLRPAYSAGSPSGIYADTGTVRFVSGIPDH